jgi:hypothetical protein
MTDVRITKLERHEGGFYTANVTPAGHDTVRVDTRIGCWTLPVDRRADFTSNQIRRREVIPAIAHLLWKRVKSFERGEAADERPVDVKTNGRPADPTPINPKAIGAAMAQAAANAVKEAA